MPRFVSWAAVSSERQAEKISLADQQRVNNQHVAKHDGVLVAELSVPGESRDIVELSEACQRMPDAYGRLRELIDAKAFDVLICLNRTRLGRTLALIETIAELCRRAGISIYETQSPPPSLSGADTGMNNLLVDAIGSFEAQKEVAQIKYRHRMGMIGRVRSGKFAGLLPWGYDYEYDSDGRRSVVIDEDAALVIRLIVELYIRRGWGTVRIADELNRRALPSASGNDWTKDMVRHILENPRRYAGFVQVNRRGRTNRPYIEAKGNHPAILSEAEAEAVEREAAQRQEDRQPDKRYLFSLCVWCAVCDVRMHWFTPTKKYRDKVYEYPMARCPVGGHAGSNVSDSRIIRQLRALLHHLQSPEYRQQLLIEDNDAAVDYEAHATRIRDQMADTRKALHRVDDLYIDGRLDKERYTRQVARLQSRLVAQEEDLAAILDTEKQAQCQAKRADRVIDLVRLGENMLHPDDENVTTANAFWRRHIRVWIDHGDIDIELL